MTGAPAPSVATSARTPSADAAARTSAIQTPVGQHEVHELQPHRREQRDVEQPRAHLRHAEPRRRARQRDARRATGAARAPAPPATTIAAAVDAASSGMHGAQPHEQVRPRRRSPARAPRRATSAGTACRPAPSPRRCRPPRTSRRAGTPVAHTSARRCPRSRTRAPARGPPRRERRRAPSSRNVLHRCRHTLSARFIDASCATSSKSTRPAPMSASADHQRRRSSPAPRRTTCPRGNARKAQTSSTSRQRQGAPARQPVRQLDERLHRAARAARSRRCRAASARRTPRPSPSPARTRPRRRRRRRRRAGPRRSGRSGSSAPGDVACGPAGEVQGSEGGRLPHFPRPADRRARRRSVYPVEGGGSVLGRRPRVVPRGAVSYAAPARRARGAHVGGDRDAADGEPRASSSSSRSRAGGDYDDQEIADWVRDARRLATLEHPNLGARARRGHPRRGGARRQRLRRRRALVGADAPASPRPSLETSLRVLVDVLSG